MRVNPILILVTLLITCCNGENSKSLNDYKIIYNDRPPKSLTIIIQPFNGLPNSTLNFVAKQLKEIYSGDVIIKKSIPLPQKALNKERTRYRADTLIRLLRYLTSEEQLIIGITNKDISTTKGQKADWGVMGLGYSPGKSCIVSTFRINGKNRNEKLFKVAIHELGHTQGLAHTRNKHCPQKMCFMRDAEGKDNLDQLKYFCSDCKPALIKAGWNLK